jgi:hypothetical protein
MTVRFGCLRFTWIRPRGSEQLLTLSLRLPGCQTTAYTVIPSTARIFRPNVFSDLAVEGICFLRQFWSEPPPEIGSDPNGATLPYS